MVEPIFKNLYRLIAALGEFPLHSCGTNFKSCGDDLIYLYNKCKKLNRNIYISFTFSIRGVGLENTLKWLKENFGINTNSPQYRSEVYFGDYPFKYREFAYFHGDCIHYRESGDQMITGVIVI